MRIAGSSSTARSTSSGKRVASSITSRPPKLWPIGQPLDARAPACIAADEVARTRPRRRQRVLDRPRDRVGGLTALAGSGRGLAELQHPLAVERYEVGRQRRRELLEALRPLAP